MTGFVRSIRLSPKGASPSGSARFGRPSAIGLRSAPAQKWPWSPNRTPTSAVSSRSNDRNASASAAAVARSTALRTSGRFKTTVVTGPLFSTRTCMTNAPPLDLRCHLSPPPRGVKATSQLLLLRGCRSRGGTLALPARTPRDWSSPSPRGWVSGQRPEGVPPVGHEGHQQPHHDAPDERVGGGQFQRIARIQAGEGQGFQRERGGGEWGHGWDDQQDRPQHLDHAEGAPSAARQRAHRSEEHVELERFVCPTREIQQGERDLDDPQEGVHRLLLVFPFGGD